MPKRAAAPAPASEYQPPKLKRCPFCGARSARYRDNGIGDIYVECGDQTATEEPELYGCGATTSDVKSETHAAAAARWNRRWKPKARRVPAKNKTLLACLDLSVARGGRRV